LAWFTEETHLTPDYLWRRDNNAGQSHSAEDQHRLTLRDN